MRDKSDSRRNSKKTDTASIELVPLNPGGRFLAINPYKITTHEPVTLDLPRLRLTFNAESLYETSNLSLPTTEVAPILTGEITPLPARTTTYESSSVRLTFPADPEYLASRTDALRNESARFGYGRAHLFREDITGIPISNQLKDLFRRKGVLPTYQRLQCQAFSHEHFDNKQRLMNKANGVEIHVWFVQIALNLDAKSLLSLSEVSTTTYNLIFSNQTLLDQLNKEKRSVWVKQVTRFSRASFWNQRYVEKNVSYLLTEEEHYTVLGIPHQSGDRGFVFR